MNQGKTGDHILYPNERDIQIDTLVYSMVFDSLDISILEPEYISNDVLDFLVDVLVFCNMRLFAFVSQHHIQQNIYRIEMVSNNRLLIQVLVDG